MLTVELHNARRTGDLVNMTVQQFQAARSTKTDRNDHVVFVYDHKTSATSSCPVNFYAERYVRIFGERLLLPTGRMFPHATSLVPGNALQMTRSQYNVAINRAWTEFRSVALDHRLPDNISSRYIRHAMVTAVHEEGDTVAIAEAADHMSHSVTTAKSHYDASLSICVRRAPRVLAVAGICTAAVAQVNFA
jgi:hypothetical protein